MASSGINIQSLVDGVNMIAIRGVVHHLLGPLAPPQGSPHQFAEMYIIDNADAQAVARFVVLGQGNVDLDRRVLFLMTCATMALLWQILIEEVYGVLSSIVEYATRSAYIIERAILTPLNKDVDAFNKLINDKYAFTKHDGSPHSTACITARILWCMGSNMAFTPLSS
jgi:hypothetical protein